jgi:ABC-type glutathione transport system ATPase component
VAQRDGEALVRCKGLSIGYTGPSGNTVGVVGDVSFALAAGEALGIVGESGSGKSTLARALLGYLRGGGRFLGGTLEVDGIDVTSAAAPALASLRGLKVAMVPQNPLSSLTYHIRVGRQVEEVLATRRGMTRAQARARTLELFEEMGLPDPAAIAARYPHELSGGQRQRVVIAAALACDPALLILDEPTTALDKTTEAQVLDLVDTVRRTSGAALVLVTHDLNVVARVCDRALVMKDGRVVEEGPVAEIFGQPRTAYARELLAASGIVGRGQPPGREATAAPLLDIEAVDFAYAGASWWRRSAVARKKILKGIDVGVGRGEILGVIGESGSGKTTLGLLVAGMLAAREGRLRFEGETLAPAVAGRTRDQRRRIQMIFQDPLSSLNPRQTVATALIRPLQFFFGLDTQAARTRATDLLSRLGMGAEFLERYPRQLSGGQQQRVAIARAFAAEPDLLICDEITSALDATVQAQVLDHLLVLQRESAAAMIVITHDLSVIWKIAPRVIVLKRGTVVEQGDTATVFSRPRDPYTASLLDAATQAGRAGPGS